MGISIALVKVQFRGMSALVGATDEDVEKINQLSMDETFTTEVRKMRNSKYHRKYFALLQALLDNMPDDVKERRNVNTIEGLLIDLKLLLGHYELRVTQEGNAVFIPKSISFAAMDQLEFQKFYSRTIDIALQYYLIGSDNDAIERMVGAIIGFF